MGLAIYLLGKPRVERNGQVVPAPRGQKGLPNTGGSRQTRCATNTPAVPTPHTFTYCQPSQRGLTKHGLGGGLQMPSLCCKPNFKGRQRSREARVPTEASLDMLNGDVEAAGIGLPWVIFPVRKLQNC